MAGCKSTELQRVGHNWVTNTNYDARINDGSSSKLVVNVSSLPPTHNENKILHVHDEAVKINFY